MHYFKKKIGFIARCTLPLRPPAYELAAGSVPEGVVPDGFSPDGGVPDGAVPFISIPPGGVPEGRVPFISIPAGGVPDGWVPLFTCIPAGGVPDGAADWSDDPAAACVEAAWDCVDDAGLEVADCAEELPESDVQPATKIPATRNTDAINMIIMLLFMG